MLISRRLPSTPMPMRMHNPFARLHHKITLEEFEKSAMIATPINLLDASPIGDGAAALYIVPADSVRGSAAYPDCRFCRCH